MLLIVLPGQWSSDWGEHPWHGVTIVWGVKVVTAGNVSPLSYWALATNVGQRKKRKKTTIKLEKIPPKFCVIF